MVSCIFTDQPFDENFSELQEERRQQLMQEERQKAARGGIPSGNSDTEDTMTTSSSAPSPGTLSGSRSNQHTTPNDTSAFNTQGTSMLSMHFHFIHSVRYKFINYTRFSKSFLSHILMLQNHYDEDVLVTIEEKLSKIFPLETRIFTTFEKLPVWLYF